MERQDALLWKKKLIAFLHDPPDKCFNIENHEELAKEFLSGAGLAQIEELEDKYTKEQFFKDIKDADHFASSAERFVFPQRKCKTEYDGQDGSCFIHPISSSPYMAHKNLKAQSENLHGVLHSTVGGIESEDWRTKFFLYWRRWLENSATNSAENAENLAFLPADTRIPDHSIWNHMSVTSALVGCIENGELKPAFLLFQLNSVQEFIAQARSTRDLWSGSYLLSWLMAHAIKAITDRIGPDSIIFPSLRGNGIFDVLHKDEIYIAEWKDKDNKKMSTWERMKEEKRKKQTKDKNRVADWLLTPTLPNRFLALVPESRAEELAKFAEQAIHKELQNIGNAVWKWVSEEASKAACSGVENWKKRWDFQIKCFPQITWAVQPWLDREKCLAEFAKLPVNQTGKDDTPLQRLKDMLDFGEKWLPEEDRDSRYYKDGDVKKELNNPGILWSAHYALVDAKLAARRNTRDFCAWEKESRKKDGSKENGTAKDSLSGKEEVIGDKNFWKYLNEQHKDLFKTPGHSYGAMNLIKRLWCRDDKVPYLKEKTEEKVQGFDSVEDVAKNNKANWKDGKFIGFNNKYVAILAMDGDDMGKWISGEKTPEFLKQISKNAREYLEPILKKENKLSLQRLLTPSYHLQFSEALANFSTWLASEIVQAFGGQLIYAGGDDVLAMLPSDRSIECAETLRAVFRGDSKLTNQSNYNLPIQQDGFVLETAGYPLIVPGNSADVSIGLAIGHCNAPLQMLVREAHKAEKRAKKEYKKGAIAITVYKRSGEILEWGCKWDDEKAEITDMPFSMPPRLAFCESSEDQYPRSSNSPQSSHDGNEPNRGIQEKNLHGDRIALKLMKKMTRWTSGNDAPVSGRFPYALAELLAPYELGKDKTIESDKLQEIVLREFEHVVKQQAGNLKDKNELLDFGKKWLEQCVKREKLDDFVKLFLVETFINRARGDN